MDVLDDLRARDLIQDSTDLEALGERLAAGPTVVYYGCDPTADSLHAGNLIGLLVLRRLQMAGHPPIALAGGATGMIGDPSGRSDERSLLGDDELDHNVKSIRSQLEAFLDFEDPEAPARLVDNRDWTAPMSVLEFLRDVGKHVTVGQMLGKESVRARLETEQGISYTEFSYMLLQANDFAHLAEHHGCELQIGGGDQWGNIALGVDLTRRRLGRRVHGFTWPLLTRADGTKYGKTAGGETAWLSPERTSPYAFYQSWVQVPDDHVGRLLAQLTLLSLEELAEVVTEHERAPERRVAQLRLAWEVTELVHGREASEGAAAASAVLFGDDPHDAAPATFEILAAELDTTDLAMSALQGGQDPVDLLSNTSLVASRSEARRTVAQGGLYVNGRRVGENERITDQDVAPGGWMLVRRGKKAHHLIRVQP